MLKVIVVGVGGFLGATARYGLSGLVHRKVDTYFPVGTMVVNVTGCLVIGVLMSLIEDRQLFSLNTRLFLTSGLLGGFTTFSSFGYETIELFRAGSTRLAILNVMGNTIISLVAVFAGWSATRAAVGFGGSC